jgi:hypothetical protein
VTQYYVPVGNPVRPAGPVELVYQPRVLGFADVVFADRRKNLEFRRTYRYLGAPPTVGEPVNWHAAEPFAGSPAETPEADARWADVPESLSTGKKLTALKRGFAEFLSGNARYALIVNNALGLVSQPGEDAEAFRERCHGAARQEAERALEAEKRKYAPKFKALNAELPENPMAAKQGGSWFPDLGWGLFAMTGVALPPPARLSEKDRAKLEALQKDWRQRWQDVTAKWRQAGDDFREVQLTPRKADVHVTHFGLAWVPYWNLTGADGQAQLLPAYR